MICSNLPFLQLYFKVHNQKSTYDPATYTRLDSNDRLGLFCHARPDFLFYE